MKKFSWKAEQKTAPHWYKIQGCLPNRYLQCVMLDSICIYKPSMKGGHTHNHVFNVVNRHTFRKKKKRLKAKNSKFLFDRSPKETLEDSLNHWAIFKKIFYNKV